MQKLFLLDAYALIYRAYYALIKNPRINSKGFNVSAIYGFVNTLEEIISKHNPTHIAVAFDPAGKTFRHDIFPEYKAQRESTPEDIRKSIPYIKDIIKAYNIKLVEEPGFEADDVIGTIAQQASQKGFITYMMTPDKDYGQLVTENTFIYKPAQFGTGAQVLGPKEVCEKYGIQSPLQVIDILGLMGDAVDNVPGCAGVGPKTATSLIQDFGNIEGIYENITKVKGKLKEKLEENKEKVIFSKYLVTIKTDVPINFDEKEFLKKDIDKQKLKTLFEELEFNSLIKKICKDTSPIQKNPDNGVLQLDFFNSFQTNESEVPENENLNQGNHLNFIYKIVDNEEEAVELCDKILTNKKISFEIACDTITAVNAKIIGISFFFGKNETFYIPLNKINIFEKLKKIFEDKSIEKISHNIKFHHIAFSNYNISIEGKIFDTLLAHYVLQPEQYHNLDYLAQIYFDFHTKSLETYFGTKWKTERNMEFLDIDTSAEFTCQRAYIAWQLQSILYKELNNTNVLNYYENTEVPLAKVLASMEKNGVCINTQALAETSRLFTSRMNEYENTVFELSGTTFNLSSPRQVGEVLFDKLQLDTKAKRTKSGQYVTNETVLEELRPKSRVVDYILKYRGMKKLISTYVDALPALINPQTKHIHSSFNQATTATGRLSSSNPNLQNIPVRGEDGKEIRKAFIPEPGCLFFSADYSQIELRIMAHLSHDQNMIKAFNDGLDIHVATAANVYHKDIKDVTEQERRKAKTANFGIIYGITTFGLAQRMDVPRSEAKELIEKYFNTYPSVHQYMQDSIESAREKGYVETIFKRRRYLPDIHSSNSVVRGYAERNAINAPIQGSASDIIKIAMVNIFNRFKEEGIRSKMILQVHDELNFSVYPEEKELVEQIVKTEMEKAYCMQVPLIADCGWGGNWLEAH